MKNNSNNKNIFAALLLSSTFVVSGCASTSTPAPTAKIGTEFKQSISTQQMKNAITNAAQQNGWEIVKTSANAQELVLKKTITTKETAPNARGRTWNKVMVDKEVFANVKINDSAYNIDLSKESQKHLSNYYSEKSIQGDFKNLEKSIQGALIKEVL